MNFQPLVTFMWLRSKGVKETKYRGEVNNTKLEGIVNNLKIFDRRLYIRAKQTGSWLTIQGTTLNGTVLLAMEFSNFLCARYKVTPLI